MSATPINIKRDEVVLNGLLTIIAKGEVIIDFCAWHEETYGQIHDIRLAYATIAHGVEYAKLAIARRAKEKAQRANSLGL